MAPRHSRFHPATAAVTEAWVQRYRNVGYTSNDQAFKAACDAAGDVFVVGATVDSFGAQGVVRLK